MRKLFFKGRFVLIPIGIVCFLSLISLVVMLLWNSLLPDLLHVPAISFWQAMGLFILCKLLFGFGKGNPGAFRSRWGRPNIEERFKNFTPEEREKFKQKMAERGMCGPWMNRRRRHTSEEDQDNPTKETAD